MDEVLEATRMASIRIYIHYYDIIDETNHNI